MRPGSFFRSPAGITAAAGLAVFIAVVLHLVLTAFEPFDAAIDYDPDFELPDATRDQRVREWGGGDNPVAETVPEPAGSSRTVRPPRGHTAPVHPGSGVDRLLETALDNPVNRKVSLFMAGKTLERMEERAAPGSPVQQDMVYVRAVFDTVRRRLDDGRINEAALRQALPQFMAMVRDQRLTPAEFDRGVRLVSRQLDADIRPEELTPVLERMRNPAHRAEVKRLLSSEAGALARSFAGNPVSRRLGVFVAGQVFEQYEDRICAKLPRELTCNEARRLFETTMQHIVKERISEEEVGKLAGMVADMLMDRRLTPREVEQLVVFIRQAAM